MVVRKRCFCLERDFRPSKLMSDSCFSAYTRHRRPYSTSGRSPELDLVDDAWASASLSDDDVEVHRHELTIAPILDEGDLDIDAVVVSNGQMGSAFTSAMERRRKDETKWSELALDIFLLDSKKRDNLLTRDETVGPNPVGGVPVESQSSTDRDPDRSSDTSSA
jgi:hypothetical protein